MHRFEEIWLSVLLFAVLFLGVSDARATPPLEVYGNLPQFENAALSSSGKRIALIATLGEVRRLLVLEGGKTPILNVGVGDSKIRSLHWAGDESVLLRTSTTVDLTGRYTAQKAEIQQMLVVPLSKRRPWYVFQGKNSITGGIQRFYGVYQREGGWYGAFGGLTMERSKFGAYHLLNGHPDLYEVDLQDGGARRIARRYEGGTSYVDLLPGRSRRFVTRYSGSDGYFDWALDATGNVVARLEFNLSTGEWQIKNAGGKVIANGRNRDDIVTLIGLGRTADTLVYELNSAQGGRRFAEIPLAGGRPVALASAEILDVITDARSRQLIGYVSDEDQPRDHFYAPGHQKIMAATQRAFPNLNVRLVDKNETFDRLIVLTDGPGDPGTWWTVDMTTGDAVDLGQSYPVAAGHVAPTRVVQYRAADGLAISGVLTLPPGREPKMLPVIVLPHGGPAARDYPTFNWWPQALASRGYVVFQPNFRGSTGYGDAFRNAGFGQWGRKIQTDISDGLAELVRRGLVDPKRACIMGSSYGGYAALAGVTLQQGIYRCAVAVAGLPDLRRYYLTEMRESDYNSGLARAFERQMGPAGNLDEISPSTYVSQADAPILLIHGKDDAVVPYEQSAAMARALKAANKPVEFVTLDGEDHWISRGVTRLAMLKAMVDFVERHNPPDPTPKSAQFSRASPPRQSLPN